MFKAKLASPSALAWLDATSEAITFSVHKSSCNLISGEGKLLSVVLAEIGPGPFSLVVDQETRSWEPEDRPFSDLQIDTPVIVSERMIDIDGIQIDARDVVIWEPRPEWGSIDGSTFNDSSSELKRNLMLFAAPGSLSSIVNDGVLDSAQSQLYRSWNRISDDLRKLDLSEVKDEIGRIAGLGVGLTPAGDDFLLGVMMAIWLLTPSSVAERLTMDVSCTVTGKTTLLSESYIKAAGRGEASYQWHELIKAIVAGNKQRLQKAAIQLMRTGSTSGSDALTGFLLACDVLVNNH